MKKVFLVSILLLCAASACWSDTAPGLEGTWIGILTGPGNHIVTRIGGNPGRYTSTSDSPDQGVIGLPTEVTMDSNNNVTIKIDDPNPLKFVGVLSGNSITGTWSEDTHTGPMTYVRNIPPADSAGVGLLPHLNGTWSGATTGGFVLHYIFHIAGSPGYYRATADSPDQNASGLSATAKVDELNNVFLSIGFDPPLYFSGVLNGDTIIGVYEQAGGISKMTLTRQSQH